MSHSSSVWFEHFGSAWDCGLWGKHLAPLFPPRLQMTWPASSLISEFLHRHCDFTVLMQSCGAQRGPIPFESPRGERRRLGTSLRRQVRSGSRRSGPPCEETACVSQIRGSKWRGHISSLQVSALQTGGAASEGMCTSPKLQRWSGGYSEFAVCDDCCQLALNLKEMKN